MVRGRNMTLNCVWKKGGDIKEGSFWKNVKVIIFVLIFVFLPVISINAQTIEVYASTDTTNYYVGDYITYTLELKYDKGITVEIPPIPSLIENLELVKVLNPVQQTNDLQITEIHEYVFSKYDSSGITIPSIPIVYTKEGDNDRYTINTNEIDIVVETLEVDLNAEIQDVKAPIKIQLDWYILTIIALIILVILLVLYYLYRRYFKKEQGTIVKKRVLIIPPYKIALSELRKLEEKKLWQQGKVKDFHSEITGIIRKYFEDRFYFLALEMPSSEIMDQLKDIKKSKPVLDLTKEFLSNADLVKFAKFEPLPSINEEMINQAYDIVNRTKPEEEVTQVEEVANVE
jgi:heme/copper-type cytochrome/quinol oxidase subunit 2